MNAREPFARVLRPDDARTPSNTAMVSFTSPEAVEGQAELEPMLGGDARVRDRWWRHARVIGAFVVFAALGGVVASMATREEWMSASELSRRRHRARRRGGFVSGEDEAPTHGPTPTGDGRGNVALMIGGAVRAFVLPMVHQGLKTYLVDEIEKRGAKVHTFMEISLDDASSWHRHAFPKIMASELQPAIDLLEPVSVRVHVPSHGVATSRGHVFGRPCHRRVTPYALEEATTASFNQSQKLFCATRKSGIHFDWYIRTRTDFTWYAPIPRDLGGLIASAVPAPKKAILFDSSWPWFYNDGFYAVHKSLAVDLWSRGVGILADLPCEYTDHFKGGQHLPRSVHDRVPGVDRLGPEALLHKTCDWLGAKPQGFRLDFHACIPNPGARGLRCAKAANGRIVTPAARAGERIIAEVNAYARRAAKGNTGVIKEFGPAC